MRKGLIFMLLLCLIQPLSMKADDYILMEALIKNHKDISNLLLERTGIEMGFTGSHALLEEANTEYHEVHTTLDNRYSCSLTDLNLVIEVARLTDKVVKATNISELAYKEASKLFLKYPYMVEVMVGATNRMGRRLEEIVRITGIVITGGVKLTLATAEQRLEYLNMISDRITWIFNDMNKIVQHCDYLTRMELGVLKGIKRSEKEILERSKKRVDKMIKSYADDK